MSVACAQKTAKGLGTPGTFENEDPYPESGQKAYKGLDRLGQVLQNPATWVPWPACLRGGCARTSSSSMMEPPAGSREDKSHRRLFDPRPAHPRVSLAALGIAEHPEAKPRDEDVSPTVASLKYSHQLSAFSRQPSGFQPSALPSMLMADS